MLKEPSPGELFKRLSAMETTVNHINETTTATTNTLAHVATKTSTGVRPSARSWADIVAHTAPPPPTHVTPPSTYLGASKTSGSEPELTAPRDRELTVKIKEAGVIDDLRKRQPVELRERVNGAINASRDTSIGGIKIVAARQLKSGDVRLTASTKRDADALRVSEAWVKELGDSASIARRTFGAVINGVPLTSIRADRLEESIQKLIAQNRLHIGEHLTITYVGWLNKGQSNKKCGSLIVECTTPEACNVLLQRGLIVDGCIYYGGVYNRSARRKQCFKCFKYGHIAAQCIAHQRCGYCAKIHGSEECPSKDSPDKKCAACGGNHTAWSKTCPEYVKESARVARELEETPILWPCSSTTAAITVTTASTSTGTNRNTGGSPRDNNATFRRNGGASGASGASGVNRNANEISGVNRNASGANREANKAAPAPGDAGSTSGGRMQTRAASRARSDGGTAASGARPWGISGAGTRRRASDVSGEAAVAEDTRRVTRSSTRAEPPRPSQVQAASTGKQAPARSSTGTELPQGRQVQAVEVPQARKQQPSQPQQPLRVQNAVRQVLAGAGVYDMSTSLQQAVTRQGKRQRLDSISDSERSQNTGELSKRSRGRQVLGEIDSNAPGRRRFVRRQRASDMFEDREEDELCSAVTSTSGRKTGGGSASTQPPTETANSPQGDTMDIEEEEL